MGNAGKMVSAEEMAAIIASGSGGGGGGSGGKGESPEQRPGQVLAGVSSEHNVELGAYLLRAVQER